MPRTQGQVNVLVNPVINQQAWNRIARSFPLGRISGDISQFQSSLDAAAARTTAFAVSAGALAGTANLVRNVATAFVDVEDALVNINSIFQLSQRDLGQFGKTLFTVARNTATSFSEASEAAQEFARQGLSVVETSKRVEAALTLAKLSGLSVTESTQSLTAALNGFSKEGLTAIEIVDKLATVDAAFAVSSADLAAGLSRVGDTAQSAGVGLDQLLASVAAIQQRTARGGPVIANGLKSIFTRLQRSGVQDTLNAIGVQTQDANGEFRSAIDVLEDYAKVYGTLSDAQRAYTDEQIAGLYQINTLKAFVADLSSETGAYARARDIAAQSDGQAKRRLDELTKSTKALGQQTLVSLTEAGSNLGKNLFGDLFTGVLGTVGDVAAVINKAFDEDNLSTGAKVLRRIVEDIGNFISGPGLVGAVFLMGKLFGRMASDVLGAAKTAAFMGSRLENVKSLQGQINAFVQNDVQLQQRLLSLGSNRLAQQATLLNYMKQQAAFQSQMAALGASVVPAVAKRASFSGKGQSLKVTGYRAGGYVNTMPEQMMINEGVGGARPSDKPSVIKNFNYGGGKKGTVVANTGEWVVPNFGGGTAIFNRDMVKQYGLPDGAKKISAAGGYVPNFANKTRLFRGIKTARLMQDYDENPEYNAAISLSRDIITKANDRDIPWKQALFDNQEYMRAATIASEKIYESVPLPSDLGSKRYLDKALDPSGTFSFRSLKSLADTNLLSKEEKNIVARSKRESTPHKFAQDKFLDHHPYFALRRHSGGFDESDKRSDNPFAPFISTSKDKSVAKDFASIYDPLYSRNPKLQGIIQELDFPTSRIITQSKYSKLIKRFNKGDKQAAIRKVNEILLASSKIGLIKGGKKYSGKGIGYDVNSFLQGRDLEEGGFPNEEEVTLLAKGYVPNFANPKSIKYNSKSRIAKTDAGSYLTYGLNGGQIDLKYINSLRKGDGFSLFSRLADVSKRAKKPISSKYLDLQEGYDKPITANQDNLLRAFPQLRYRMGRGSHSGTMVAGADRLPFNSIDEILSYVSSNKVKLNELEFRDILSSYAGGYAPLSKAIAREASVRPLSSVRINQSPSLASGTNPFGLAVTNTIDEPRGLSDVPASRKYSNKAGGYVPNFAAPPQSYGTTPPVNNYLANKANSGSEFAFAVKLLKAEEKKMRQAEKAARKQASDLVKVAQSQTGSREQRTQALKQASGLARDLYKRKKEEAISTATSNVRATFPNIAPENYKLALSAGPFAQKRFSDFSKQAPYFRNAERMMGVREIVGRTFGEDPLTPKSKLPPGGGSGMGGGGGIGGSSSRYVRSNLTVKRNFIPQPPPPEPGFIKRGASAVGRSLRRGASSFGPSAAFLLPSLVGGALGEERGDPEGSTDFDEILAKRKKDRRSEIGTSTLQSAVTGGALGASFGPIGAIVGAVGGAAVGLVSSFTKTADSLEALTIKQVVYSNEIQKAGEQLATIDVLTNAKNSLEEATRSGNKEVIGRAQENFAEVASQASTKLDPVLYAKVLGGDQKAVDVVAKQLRDKQTEDSVKIAISKSLERDSGDVLGPNRATAADTKILTDAFKVLGNGKNLATSEATELKDYKKTDLLSLSSKIQSDFKNQTLDLSEVRSFADAISYASPALNDYAQNLKALSFDQTEAGKEVFISQLKSADAALKAADAHFKLNKNLEGLQKTTLDAKINLENQRSSFGKLSDQKILRESGADDFKTNYLSVLSQAASERASFGDIPMSAARNLENQLLTRQTFIGSKRETQGFISDAANATRGVAGLEQITTQLDSLKSANIKNFSGSDEQIKQFHLLIEEAKKTALGNKEIVDELDQLGFKSDLANQNSQANLKLQLESKELFRKIAEQRARSTFSREQTKESLDQIGTESAIARRYSRSNLGGRDGITDYVQSNLNNPYLSEEVKFKYGKKLEKSKINTQINQMLGLKGIGDKRLSDEEYSKAFKTKYAKADPIIYEMDADILKNLKEARDRKAEDPSGIPKVPELTDSQKLMNVQTELLKKAEESLKTAKEGIEATVKMVAAVQEENARKMADFIAMAEKNATEIAGKPVVFNGPATFSGPVSVDKSGRPSVGPGAPPSTTDASKKAGPLGTGIG